MGRTKQFGYLLATAALLGTWSGVGVAQVTVDGSLGTAQALSGPNYVIDASLGQIRGRNVFHSFGEFNVSTGEIATFIGPATIENIVGRVTGGSRSVIDGTLRSTIAGADLYLLNPSGFLFGPNASLDVSGAFRVSTADFLRFADDGIFYADVAGQTVLSVAAPKAFGFLRQQQPMGITVNRSQLRGATGRGLSFVAGDVHIVDGALVAPSGQIEITTVGSPAEVGLSASSGPTLDPLVRSGTVNVQGSVVTTSGDPVIANPGGTVAIRGGQIVVEQSSVSADGNPGGVLNIEAEQLHMSNTNVSTATRGAADHPGIAVEINVTGHMAMTNGSEIASSSFGSGRAGGVRIVAGNMTLGDDDPATSPFSGTGFYGDIGSRAFGLGRGGDVDIASDTLVVKNGFFINTAALSRGDAGNVTIRTDQLSVLDGASISSNGFGLGRGGVVDIVTGEALVSATNINSVPNCACLTGIAAQAGFGSPGGALHLSADSLQLIDGGRISTVLFSIGPGADVDITAKSVVISGSVQQATAGLTEIRAGVDARLIGSFATGFGGNVWINADSLQILNGGAVNSSLDSGASGTAGNITVSAGHVDLHNRGFIAASSLFGSGTSGRIEIQADTLTIEGVADSPDPFITDFTGLSTTVGSTALAGGDLWVKAKALLINDKGTISSPSLGFGQAGNIRIDAGNMQVTGGATVAASAFGSGPGGMIEITADDLTVSGAGKFLDATNAGISAIASQSGLGGGDAGDVRVTANQLKVLDGAKLTTETFGSGAGGNIVVHAGTIIVSGVNSTLRASLASEGGDLIAASAAIAADSNRFFTGNAATGRAGNILIVADDIVVSTEGVISSSTDTSGAGGKITLSADRLFLTGRAQVLSSTENPGTGPGGDIVATAREVDLNDSTISARSSGSVTAVAGDVSIVFGERFAMKNSTLSTAAAVADGGNISITSLGSMLLLRDSNITTSVQSGTGAGGNISIGSALHPIEFVVLNGSTVRADAFGGPGGNVGLTADVYLTSNSQVSASSALGVPGTIDVQARITDVSGSVAELPEALLKATLLLRASCAARLAEGKASSFVVTGRDALPAEPGGLLPSYVVNAPSPGSALTTGATLNLETRGDFPVRLLDAVCSR